MLSCCEHMLNGARRGEHVEYTAIHTFKALLLVTHSCRHASSGSGVLIEQHSHITFDFSPFSGCACRAVAWSLRRSS